jgi:hypothetical protein
MNWKDSEYFMSRATEERAAAARAVSAAAAAIHEDIAQQYEKMAEAAPRRSVLTPHYGA